MLWEAEFYGDLVYKFKKIVGKTDFSDQFRKIIIRYKRIGYNVDVMRQYAYLVLTQSRLITMLHSLIVCRLVGRQTMMAPTQSYYLSWLGLELFRLLIQLMTLFYSSFQWSRCATLDDFSGQFFPIFVIIIFALLLLYVT